MFILGAQLSPIIHASEIRSINLLSRLGSFSYRFVIYSLGMHCTCHRVFLASLILAAKYLNDQSPKNKHWSAHSTVFSVGEVNLMEKQLLSLLVSGTSPPPPPNERFFFS